MGVEQIRNRIPLRGGLLAAGPGKVGNVKLALLLTGRVRPPLAGLLVGRSMGHAPGCGLRVAALIGLGALPGGGATRCCAYSMAITLY